MRLQDIPGEHLHPLADSGHGVITRLKEQGRLLAKPLRKVGQWWV